VSKLAFLKPNASFRPLATYSNLLKKKGIRPLTRPTQLFNTALGNNFFQYDSILDYSARDQATLNLKLLKIKDRTSTVDEFQCINRRTIIWK
jgi:hypothetical protein